MLWRNSRTFGLLIYRLPNTENFNFVPIYRSKKLQLKYNIYRPKVIAFPIY